MRSAMECADPLLGFSASFEFRQLGDEIMRT